jgi:hypothetical protein
MIGDYEYSSMEAFHSSGHQVVIVVVVTNQRKMWRRLVG